MILTLAQLDRLIGSNSPRDYKALQAYVAEQAVKHGFPTEIHCECCNGTGRDGLEECWECDGAGVVALVDCVIRWIVPTFAAKAQPGWDAWVEGGCGVVEEVEEAAQ